MSESSEPKPAPEPKPAARGNPLTMPLLAAGVLGGLLGGLFGFALARTFPAVPKPPPPPPKSEAREFAEQVFELLKAGKHDDFVSALRPAFAEASDEQFAEVRKRMFEARENDIKMYGTGGEFEFCRESVLSPTLVRVIFIEKFARGCKVWSMIVYHASDGWKVVSCDVRAPGAATGAPLQ